MPNIHYWLFDLARLGVKDNKEVFFPTDDPNGYIVVKGLRVALLCIIWLIAFLAVGREAAKL